MTSIDDQVAIVEEKVARYLAEGTPLVGGQDGETPLSVTVETLEERWTVVRIDAGVLVGADVSDELVAYVALHSADAAFGTLRMSVDEADGDRWCYVWLTYTILGDYLDREELRVPLRLIASHAASLADELIPRFGGRRRFENDE